MKKFLLIVLSFIVLTVVTQAQGQQPHAIAPMSQEPAPSILRFFPNPATTYITYNFQKNYDKGYSIKVYNFLGKKMYESANLNQQATIDLSDFNRGIYIYQLFDKSGKQVESGKFQISTK